VSLIDAACPSSSRRSTFDDIKGNSHRDGIVCVTERHIARGRSPRRFAPADAVTRGQVATFARNLIRAAGGRLPRSTAGGFPDTDGTVHADAINRLTTAGVVNGFSDGSYRPERPITRAQAVSILDRARSYVADAESRSPSLDAFVDDNGSVHEVAINIAAYAGIALGSASGRFGTDARVSRAQMATMLTRTLGVLAVGP
jgi:hypothetical protein